jgi:hypothetical protein
VINCLVRLLTALRQTIQPHQIIGRLLSTLTLPATRLWCSPMVCTFLLSDFSSSPFCYASLLGLFGKCLFFCFFIVQNFFFKKKTQAPSIKTPHIVLGDMTQWLLTTYFQAAGEFYGLAQRHVISSSYSTYPYTAGWYHRVGANEDPNILIYGVYDSVNRMLYSLRVIEFEKGRKYFFSSQIVLVSVEAPV